MKTPDHDSVLQIRNLDTGDVISIEEMEKTLNDGAKRSRANTVGPRANLPPGIQFSTFLKQKKDFLFKNSYISDFISPHRGNVRCLAVSKDGRYAASGGEDGKIVLYNTAGPLKIEKTYNAHSSDIVMLEFSSDNFLISCSLDSTAKIWHPSRENALGTFEHEEPVTSIAFMPNNSSIFMASTLKDSVFIWDIRKNEVIHKAVLMSPPTAVAFSPDGKYATLGCLNGFCYIYEFPDFRYVTQFISGPRGKKIRYNKKVTSISFVGDNHFLVATNDSRIRLFTLENFSVIRKFLGHEGNDSQILLSISPDSQMFMAPCENTSDVLIWPIDHSQSFKASWMFSTFLKDRSKTCECMSFGKNVVVNATCFLPNSTVNKLSVLVALHNGSIIRVQSQ